MQTALLPVSLCDEIERIIRKFLWGGGHKEHPCSLVNWETIVKSKQHGGLAIRRLRDMNLAFMAKLGWKMLTEKEALVCKYSMGRHGWKWSQLSTLLPADILQHLSAYIIIEDDSCSDEFYWSPSQNGFFTVSTAYKLSIGDSFAIDRLWMIIWHLQKQEVLNFGDWLQYNLCTSMSIDGFPNWPEGFALIIWWLWKWKNAGVFKGERFYLEHKCAWIRIQVVEIAQAMVKPVLFENSTSTSIIQRSVAFHFDYCCLLSLYARMNK
ncbi:hypothetical protein DITRI_Ditri12bG0029000 [Diplodiscus trichospermus]